MLRSSTPRESALKAAAVALALLLLPSRAFAQGSIQQTGNPLDIAIEGSGFIGVTRSSGEIAYTRAGNLKVDAQGRLCTNDGLAVEPPITVPTAQLFNWSTAQPRQSWVDSPYWRSTT